MARSNCTAEDYIQWLIASPKNATMTEASRCSPQPRAHDTFRRLLLRLEPSSDALWEEVKDLVQPNKGVLIVDDSTLDKPYGPQIDMVQRHWSGKHSAVVLGINLITLMWTDGVSCIPIDYRIFNKDSDGKTKNDHFLDMLNEAHRRAFQPVMVLFDSWYSSIKNLKTIRGLGWRFLTTLKRNRIVSVSNGSRHPVSALLLDEEGCIVHLKRFGPVRVFQLSSTDGRQNRKIWVTNASQLEQKKRISLTTLSTSIESYHRELKQQCNVERCQARKATIQRNHIGLSIRAYVRLAVAKRKTGRSMWELASSIIREAVRNYLRNPSWILATA